MKERSDPAFSGNLKKWAHVNLMMFNKAKGEVLCLGWDNPHYQYRLGDEDIEIRPVQKDLGVLLEEKLHKSVVCAHRQES